jgi:protein gp37
MRSGVVATSNIEWTEATWNPTTGCEQISAGCDRCYAMRLVNTRQIRNSRSPRFGHPFSEVMLHEKRLRQPMSWKMPMRVFVNSMSDVWHRDVPAQYIDAIFDVMEATPRHTFQVLTKRTERMRRYINRRYPNKPCPRHIWIGVSVEDYRVGWRVEDLHRANASVRWMSAEPLLGSLDAVSLENIDWVVAGGESGKGARPMDLGWARELRDRCIERGIPYFLKQLGGEHKKRGKNEAILDGRRWTEYPKATRATR